MRTLQTPDRSEKTIAAFLAVAALLAYVFFLFPANVDLSEGVRVLFMDEQISFDAVHDILHSTGIGNFAKNVCIGGDQRYGLIIYNFSALVAFIPERIWGEPGQIIAVRMLLFILLIISYFLLTRTFIKRPFYRAIAFATLLCIPTTAYFSTMPKPEPFLLFFLALFLNKYVKKDYRFGPHFIWLGIAFGCKISLLFPMLFFIFLSLVTEFNSKGGTSQLPFLKKKIDSRLLHTIYGSVFFIIGLVIAMPMLALAIRRRSYLYLYIRSTFQNTQHGADDSTINIFVWVKQIFTNWLEAPVWISIPVSILLLVIICLGVRSVFSEKKWGFYRSPFSLAVVTGFLFTVPILLLTKRTWFFYLHPGIVFFIVSFFASLEIIPVKTKMMRFVVPASLTIFLLFSVFFSFKQQRKELITLAERTKDPSYQVQKERYTYFTSLMLNESKDKPQEKISAYLSPAFFRYTNKDFPIETFGGFFTEWKQGRTFVFLAKSSNPKTYEPTSTNLEYAQWKLASDEYNKHVGDSAIVPAYIPLPQKANGLFAFKRVR